ncbi:hypothetical protein WN944_020065 [Citrus x changshan-huyou]|uniref:Uncharacterized protein n=1 Tax=Citrus x changshan-huyou TaxID=2935761 RepID=A0AAP0QFR4_9ROSI
MESSQYQTIFVKFGQSKLVKYFIHGNYFRIQFLKLEPELLFSFKRFNTKEEIMESQNQLSQPRQQSEGSTTFLRTCFNGLNVVSGLLSHALSQVTIN